MKKVVVIILIIILITLSFSFGYFFATRDKVKEEDNTNRIENSIYGVVKEINDKKLTIEGAKINDTKFQNTYNLLIKDDVIKWQNEIISLNDLSIGDILYISFVNDNVENYKEIKLISSESPKDIKCLNNLLGGYITSEKEIPRQINLEDIINTDGLIIDYSKINITDNNIYIILKTSNSLVTSALEDYLNNHYNGYQKAEFNSYLIYLYNGNNDYDLKNVLKECE